MTHIVEPRSPKRRLLVTLSGASALIVTFWMATHIDVQGRAIAQEADRAKEAKVVSDGDLQLKNSRDGLRTNRPIGEQLGFNDPPKTNRRNSTRDIDNRNRDWPSSGVGRPLDHDRFGRVLDSRLPSNDPLLLRGRNHPFPSPHDSKSDILRSKIMQLLPDDPQRKELVDQLKEEVEQEFQRMHEEQGDLLKRAADRLKKLQDIHAQREERKDEIIRRRVAQLTGQPDILDWAPQQIPANLHMQPAKGSMSGFHSDAHMELPARMSNRHEPPRTDFRSQPDRRPLNQTDSTVRFPEGASSREPNRNLRPQTSIPPSQTGESAFDEQRR